jgi:amidase
LPKREAFVPVAPVQANGIIQEMLIEGRPSGLLSGLKFAVKDNLDIEGFITGAGNPDWITTHMPCESSAPAINMLLSQGATLVGKTMTDELAFSLDGVNVHYGSAHNSVYPACITGGSSAGSAAAVASGCVDFSLGTDTGGSVRIPASFCGIYGMRPTHGRISTEGVVPLVPPCDTVGWFARDAELLEKCGLVLLGESANRLAPRPKRILIAKDAFQVVSPDIKQEIDKALLIVSANFSESQTISLSELQFDEFSKWFRIMQGWEAWRCHGPWIKECAPKFGQAIEERFQFASHVSESDFLQASSFVQDLRRKCADLLADDEVLCLPTAWHEPPAKRASAEEFMLHRSQNMKLTTMASLLGTPQVSIPIKGERGPLALSFLAQRNNDALLLRLCRELDLAV